MCVTDPVSGAKKTTAGRPSGARRPFGIKTNRKWKSAKCSLCECSAFEGASNWSARQKGNGGRGGGPKRGRGGAGEGRGVGSWDSQGEYVIDAHTEMERSKKKDPLAWNK